MHDNLTNKKTMKHTVTKEEIKIHIGEKTGEYNICASCSKERKKLEYTYFGTFRVIKSGDEVYLGKSLDEAVEIYNA